MKFPSLHRLWKHLTTERFAVAVFLAVAFGLWWGMQTLPEARVGLPDVGWNVRVKYSPEGKYVAVGQNSRRLTVFDTATGTKVWSHVPDDYFELGEFHWTRNHQLFFKIMTWSHSGTPTTFQVLGIDMEKGRDFCFRSDHFRTHFLGFDVAPDGRTLALRKGGGSLAVLDVADGQVRRTYPDGGWLWNGFSPDSTRLLLHHSENFWPWPDRQSWVEMQETSTGKALVYIHDVDKRRPFDIDSPWEYAFSKDSRLLAVGTGLWDTASGQLLHKLNLQEIACGLSPEEKPCLKPEWVRYVHLDNHDRWLTVVTTPIHAPREGPRPDPFEKYSGCSRAIVSLFDLQEQRIVHLSKFACLPVFADNYRYMAVKAKQGEEYGIRIEDLHTAKEIIFLPHPNGKMIDFLASVRGESGKDLVVFRTRSALKKPLPWLVWLLSWWNKPREDETLNEVHFLDPASGYQIDQWSFTSKDTQTHLSPTGQQLLLVHDMPGGVLVEFYSLPPRRPWFHIFGWALAAGITVELLGLLRRWRASGRQPDVRPESTSA